MFILQASLYSTTDKNHKMAKIDLILAFYKPFYNFIRICLHLISKIFLMKKVSCILLLLCCAVFVNASTSITTPNVSGHWTLAGSPYEVFNNITVNAGQSLIIDPGVE